MNIDLVVIALLKFDGMDGELPVSLVADIFTMSTVWTITAAVCMFQRGMHGKSICASFTGEVSFCSHIS